MANIIQCRAQAEPCQTGDRGESRQRSGGDGATASQQPAQTPAPADGNAGGGGGVQTLTRIGGGDSSCPITAGAGGGQQGSAAATTPAGGSGAASTTGNTPAGGDTVESGAANDAAIDCGGQGSEAQQGHRSGPSGPPPVQPIGIEVPEPLAEVSTAEVTLALAPTLVQLAVGDLEFPQQQTDESDDSGEQAIDAVLAAYAGTRRKAEVRLNEHRAAAAASIAAIAERFVAIDEQMRADQMRLDDRLLLRHQGLVFDLQAHRDEALARIDGGRGGARNAIFQARNQGHQALRRKIDNTSARITEIVELAILPYRQILDGAVQVTRTEITAAENTLRTWRTGINGQFPLFADTRMDGAINEGKREAARCGVDKELPRVSCRGQQLGDTFERLIEPFEQHARQSLEPSMRAEARRAEACGFSAIDAAVERSIQAVDQGHAAGRDWVKSQAAASERQLTQMLNGARSGLRTQVEAKRNHLRHEADQGRRRIAEAHDNQQIGIADALTGYRDSILGTAPQGQQAFRATGMDGARETRDAFAELGARYRDSAEQIEDGAHNGLVNSQALFQEETGASVDRQQNAAWQTLAEARERADDGVAERIAGMYRLKTGVEQTSAQWSMDYADRFTELINQTWERIDQCEPEFQSRVDAKRDEIGGWVSQRNAPDKLFKKDLDEVAEKVRGDVERRVRDLADELDDLHVGDKTVVTALRGLTWAQGRAVTERYERFGGSLIADIIDGLSGDDESAALAYLRGDQAEGAEYELKASVTWYNDDEERIRQTLRSLDDDQLKQFMNRPGVQGTISDVRGNLGGVDNDVFNTLLRTDLDHSTRLARADAQDLDYKLRHASNREEINRELTNFYSNAAARGYGNDVTDADLRRLINDQVADVRHVTDDDGNVVKGAAADQAVRGLVEERISDLDRMRCGPQGCQYRGAYGQQLERQRGAQEDLAFALIEHGVGSNQERIARLGIEITRRGGGRMENIDQALVDPRLNPQPPELEPSRYPDGRVPPEVRAQVEERRRQALADRQALLRGVAERYGDSRSAGAGGSAAQVSNLLGRGQDALGRRVVNGLVNDPFPSAETTSLILEYSAAGAGTNEALMKQATRRLNRAQIAEASTAYSARTGGDLWNLIASETSGQDFLDMELAWMGQPRNARERAEVALFAVHQQRREAGDTGAALMSGSRVERIFDADEARLQGLVGGSISFSRRGEPPAVTIRNGNFDEMGRYTGEDEVSLNVAASSARASAELYAKNIDEWASAVTTTIAIIGAVVATVVTGGGASPLLAAAIAGAIGVASMAANHAIRGGRYGWEEALTDLGMTGVQMLTAGLGQKLQAIAQASKTMGPIQQALLPAVATGSLDSLGQTVLNDATWSNGFEAGIGEVLAGTLRGAMTASVAALGTQALQKLPVGRAAGAVDDLADGAGDAARSPAWRTLGDVAGDSTGALSRSAAQSLSSGGGAFLSRGAELGFESLRGKYNGDAGDIFVEMSKSAGQAALQGIGEGSGEAMRDRRRIRFGLYTRPGWMDPGDYQRLRDAQSNPAASQVPDTGSGTAAGIAGSRFRGDLHDAPTVRDSDVQAGLKDLTGDGGPLQGRVRQDPDGAPGRALIDLDDGGSIEVHFRVVDDMTAVDGEVPVARFDPRAEGGFEVKVSSRADPELIGRALAHELTEIRVLQAPDAAQRVADGDLLSPGSGQRFEADQPPKLSPHDQGRIAEAEWLARRIDAEQARTPADSARVRMLNEEMHGLLAHLGVVGETQAPTRRRELMLEHLSDPRLKGAIEAGVQAARDNPRLHHQGIDHEAALRGMTERWQRAQAVGDEATARGLLEKIHRTLMRMERIHSDQRLTRKQQQRLDDAAADLLPHPDLVAAVKDLLRSEARVKEGHLRNDPATADPDGAQAVRREFADRVHFQDWPEFRQKYFDTFSTRNANDPVHMNRAWFDWVSGAYVSADSGRLRSVVSGVKRPDPGFEAQWLGGTRPRPDQAARLDTDGALRQGLGGLKALVDQGMVRSGDLSPELQRHIDGIAAVKDPTTSTVGEAADLRHRLLAEARRLDQHLKQPGLDPTEALRLTELHHALEHQAIRLAEALGEAAAHRVARESIPGDWEPVRFPGAGAGLPDVVYRDRKTGQLLILEAKGGSSTLGTRMDVHGRVRVEQGTRAYLESLAADMRRSSAVETRRLGAEIQRQLAKPDGIDYRAVRQPFDDSTGRPLTPEVGRFDLGPPPGAAEQVHRAAAAVPEARFHGEALPAQVRLSPDDVHGAVDRLIESAQAGIATRLKPAADAKGVYIVEHPDGRSTRVRLETVAPERLGTDAAGRRNNAEWDVDASGPADFVIQVSERSDPRQIERALVHDFREVGEFAFDGGSIRQPVAANEGGMDLASPHGRGRLEEVHWLAGRIADGDPHGVFRNELDRLMAHLGAADAPPDMRREAILAALDEQGLLTDSVRLALAVEPAAGAPTPPLRPANTGPADGAEPIPRQLPSGTIGPERQLVQDVASDIEAELLTPQQPATRAGAVRAALEQSPDLVRRIWTSPGDEHFERLLTRLVDDLGLPRADSDRLRGFFIDARRRRTAEAMDMDIQREAQAKLGQVQARGEIDADTAHEIEAFIGDSWYAARQFYGMSPQRFVELYRGFRNSGSNSFFGYLEGRGGRMATEERAMLGELTAQSVLGERGHVVLGGRDGKLPPQRVLVAGPEGVPRIEPTDAGTGISEVKQPGIDIISVAPDGMLHLVDNKAYAKSSGAIGSDRLTSVFLDNIVANLETELPRLRLLAADLAARPVRDVGDASGALPMLASDQQIIAAVGNLDNALNALRAAAPLNDLAQVVDILSQHGVKLGVMTEMGTAGVQQELLDVGVGHIT